MYLFRPAPKKILQTGKSIWIRGGCEVLHNYGNDLQANLDENLIFEKKSHKIYRQIQ